MLTKPGRQTYDRRRSARRSAELRKVVIKAQEHVAIVLLAIVGGFVADMLVGHGTLNLSSVVSWLLKGQYGY